MKNEQHQELLKLAYMKMPFGKFKGQFLSNMPETYFVWFNRQGFPKGKLGERMQMCFDLKINGQEDILFELRKRYGNPFEENQ
jgi:hypothetical protein